MQPTRTLQDIISSLNSVYQPQVDLLRQQQSAIPGQAQAQEDALGAKKDQAFDQILGGARQRGLGFSGIPLGDQAKYLSTDYLPALANLKTASTNQATSLEQAILQLQQQQNSDAQNIYGQEQDRAQSWAQFQAQQDAANRQAAAQNASLSGLFGSGSTNSAPQQNGDPIKQKAQADVANLLSKDTSRIQQEYAAIKKSAGYGNTYDQLKLQLLEYYHPELKNIGSNTVALGPANPTLVPLNSRPSSGLSVGVANPGRLAF